MSAVAPGAGAEPLSRDTEARARAWAEAAAAEDSPQ